MGILNATPDSFYNDGMNATPENFLVLADKMINDGASILDIGGVSTRPGAKNISIDEESRRVLPVIELIRKKFPEIYISVDTYNATIATLAVDCGADIVNDISAGTIDNNMLPTVRDARVPYIAMHMQGTPDTMQQHPIYKDVTMDIFDYFIRKIKDIDDAGIKDIIVDVGFGFGKTLEHNYQLLKNLHIFKMLGKPILVGLSRKSMIGKLLNVSPADSLNGSTALHMLALQQGADILRVHDVKEACEAIKIHEYYYAV